MLHHLGSKRYIHWPTTTLGRELNKDSGKVSTSESGIHGVWVNPRHFDQFFLPRTFTADFLGRDDGGFLHFSQRREDGVPCTFPSTLHHYCCRHGPLPLLRTHCLSDMKNVL